MKYKTAAQFGIERIKVKSNLGEDNNKNNISGSKEGRHGKKSMDFRKADLCNLIDTVAESHRMNV